MANANSFKKVPSLRFGLGDSWCHEAGLYNVDGQHGTSAFFFHLKRRDADGRFNDLRCKSYKDSTVKCRVIARITPTGEILKVSGIHNHLPDAEGYGVEFREARRDMITDIRENPRKRPAKVILEHRRKLPIDPASQIVPVKQARTLRLHASKMRPSMVKSLRELHVKISSDDIPGFTSTSDHQRILSFYSPEFETVVLTTVTLLRLSNEAAVIHADATYKTAPRKICKQLFTIHGNWNQYVGMVACAFMNKANFEAYQWVFQCLKQNSPGPFNIPAYMGDWDDAMRKAVRREFPEARLYGCLFHYSQSLVRKASSPAVGLANDIRRPGEILSTFLAFAALPLLPAPLIQGAFHYFANQAQDLNVGFTPFLNYVSSYWLHQIGPEDLSVYRMRKRTNNDVESNNANLLREAGVHGPCWDLVSVLVNAAQDVPVNHAIHQRGEPHILSRPSKVTRANDDRIQASWNLSDEGEIDDIQFINRVKYRVGKKNILPNLTGPDPRDPGLLAWLSDAASQNAHTSDSTESESVRSPVFLRRLLDDDSDSET